jgi:hypothetical protein
MSFTVACLKLVESFASKRARGRTSALRGSQLQEVEAMIRPILAELELLRLRTVRAIDLRALWMVPAGIVAGWVLGFAIGDVPVLNALFYAGLGGLAGWAWAFTSLNNSYRNAYKTSIIPFLAAYFGDLTYRAAREPDLKRLAKLGLVPGFGIKRVEDEILGTYRGIEVNIVEAKLETGGKNSRVVFNGLLVSLSFPGRLTGTTIVAKDFGVLRNAIFDFVQANGLARVRLEDPRFEDRYQVYSDDQIGARTLLTPAVMERLMELERHTEGDPPRLLAEHGRLQVALPKGVHENLFEPPSIANPAHGGDMLVELSSDIGSVLKLVDAVLEVVPMAPPSQPA